jgi:hypothetical protein
MNKLSENFRIVFLAYSKNPNHSSNKAALVESAYKIYTNASQTDCAADAFIPKMWKIIKPALQGIEVDSTISETLNKLCRDLSNSNDDKEKTAFHALNIASVLINPKKSCLRKAISNLLILEEKLKKEDSIITNRNYYNSFFLSNSDVCNIRGKRSVINQLIDFTCEEVFDKSNEGNPKFIPISYTVNQKIQYMEKHIDYLSEKECTEILSYLVKKINPILNAQDNPGGIQYSAEGMTDSGKKSAIKIHSFNDKWYFTFLAKMVKIIQETLKIKTSAEHILENLVNEAKKINVT